MSTLTGYLGKAEIRSDVCNLSDYVVSWIIILLLRHTPVSLREEMEDIVQFYYDNPVSGLKVIKERLITESQWKGFQPPNIIIKTRGKSLYIKWTHPLNPARWIKLSQNSCGSHLSWDTGTGQSEELSMEDITTLTDIVSALSGKPGFQLKY